MRLAEVYLEIDEQPMFALTEVSYVHGVFVYIYEAWLKFLGLVVDETLAKVALIQAVGLARAKAKGLTFFAGLIALAH